MIKRDLNVDTDCDSHIYLSSLHILPKKDSGSPSQAENALGTPSGKFVIKRKHTRTPGHKKLNSAIINHGQNPLKTTPVFSKISTTPHSIITPTNLGTQSSKTPKKFLFNTFSAQKLPLSNLTPLVAHDHHHSTPKNQAPRLGSSVLKPPTHSTVTNFTPTASTQPKLVKTHGSSLSPSSQTKTIEINGNIIQKNSKKFYFPIATTDQKVTESYLPRAPTQSVVSEVSTQSKSISSIKNTKSITGSFVLPTHQTSSANLEANWLLGQHHEANFVEELKQRLNQRIKPSILTKMKEKKQINSFKHLIFQENGHSPEEFEKYEEMISNGVHYATNLIKPPPKAFVDKISVRLPPSDSTFKHSTVEQLL